MEDGQWLREKKLFLFDMDGTICLGDRLYDFTKELLDLLKAQGRRYLFMTNNSSCSEEDYVRKMARLGIPTSAEDYITSARAMVLYLREYHRDQPLYVCGTVSFVRFLQQEGFPVTADPDRARCVIMSFDTELTFGKLRDVCKILCRHPDVPYLASHPDLACPTEFGFVPDCGSICAMVRNATGRSPVFVGKPNRLMPELAMSRTGCTPRETVVVGDRISTDIAAGCNAGVDTVLVLTGEAGMSDAADSPAKPTLVLRDAGELISYLR